MVEPDVPVELNGARNEGAFFAVHYTIKNIKCV